ncbi:hypothetical protein BC834DRAFT_847310 [Gloeopeniophorella convolvens]|nr:hypothetical protein BC834DRAFT_847310 [Gloeopeniophorella convolvens]
MLIVIDIEELEQFEGLPQTHQQVIQCASRIESALEHRQNGTSAPDAVLTYHIKQELLAIAAMVERDETIWPHPLISTLGLMFSKNPSCTLDSVNIDAVHNRCHKHQDKGVLATSNLSVYLETGPGAVEWWLPASVEDEDIEMVEDNLDVLEPPEAAQDTGGDIADNEEEEDDEITPQPTSAHPKPQLLAQSAVQATGPVTAIVVGPSVATAPPQHPPINIDKLFYSLNAEYVKGDHVNELPRVFYHTITNLTGPINSGNVVLATLQASTALVCLYNAEDFRHGQKEERDINDILASFMEQSSHPAPSGPFTSSTSLFPIRAVAEPPTDAQIGEKPRRSARVRTGPVQDRLEGFNDWM